MTPERWRRIDDLFDAVAQARPRRARGLAPRGLRGRRRRSGPKSLASWPRTSGRPGTGS